MKKTKWKWSLVFGLVGVLSGAGVEQGLGGPVMDVPPGGGGGGGGRNGQGISLGSGYDNTLGSDSSWYAQAWGNANGSLLAESIGTSFWFEPASNPQPGNAGRFNLGVSVNGSFFPADGTITPEMQRLADNPLSASGTFRINEITVEQNDKWTIYSFNPTFQLSWDSQAYLNISPERDWINGSIYANVWADGGQFTSSVPYFELNEWAGEGPRPDWLSDWSLNFSFSGLATPTSVVFIPEPATAVLLAIGGGATLWRHRRKKNRERNLIA